MQSVDEKILTVAVRNTSKITMVFVLFLLTDAFTRQMLPFTTETQAFLYNWQHRSDCASARWTTVREHYYGVGSQIHVNTAGFAAAINAGAIFLMAASDLFYDADTKAPVSACSNLYFDCVFVPISNCTRETLSPTNRVHVNPYESQFVVPDVFANVSTTFPLYYWARASSLLLLAL
jgi:hypothetical protein